MYKQKTVTVTLTVWLIVILFYYNIFNSKLLENHAMIQPSTWRAYFKGSMSKTLKNKLHYYVSENYLIDTPGCVIPNYTKTLNFKESINRQRTCYERLVFVERSSDHEVIFRIDYDKAIKQKGQKFECSYRFALRSKVPGKEDFHLTYTEYKTFQNGNKIILEAEVITISCDLFSLKNKKLHDYQDSYLILKRKPTDTARVALKDNVVLVKENWNVLVVGMDTMSRGRAYHSLPRTVKYLQENDWLDYRGYHKIAVNTFPNIMAILTGKNASSSYSACGHGMDFCEHNFIWNKYKEAGYMTAFGEDNLSLPDTFSPYGGFSLEPTDHYARPLFLTGEYRNGNVVCTKNKPSAQHLLEYAIQFTQAYKNDSFFGLFWINSYSHNPESLPTLFEDDLIWFLEKLKTSGLFNNTFVFFLSDHGTRYGKMRVFRESYYEERLPMMFMWVPYEFRETYPKHYDNLQLNQYRLTTPYDLHATLLDIMGKTSRYVDYDTPEGCQQCSSLTNEISPERTCDDVHVDQKWCSCHNMYKTNKNDSAADRSLQFAVKYIQDKASSIRTLNCTMCSPLKLKSVLRNDWYKDGNKTYYVVAFEMSPQSLEFEATVEIIEDQFTILQPTDTISQYNKKGYCVVKKFDRAYCVCMKISCKRK